MIGQDPAPFEPAQALPLALGTLAVGLPAAFLTLRAFLRRPAAPRQGSPARPQDLAWSVPFFLTGLAGAVLALSALWPEQDAPLLAMLVAVPLSLTPLVLLAVVRAREVGSWRGLGLGLPDQGACLRAVATWLGCLPLIYGLLLASPWVYARLGFPWQPQAWGGLLGGATGAEAAAAAALAVLVVPVFEELVFRGWLQQGLAASVGAPAAIGITAALFTLNHDVGSWPPILALALLLGLVRERTQRLLPSVAVHVAHNGLQVALLLAFL